MQCQKWSKLTDLTFVYQHASRSPLCVRSHAWHLEHRGTCYPIPHEVLSYWRNWRQTQAMASAQVGALFLRILISYVSGGFPHREKYFKFVLARTVLVRMQFSLQMGFLSQQWSWIVTRLIKEQEPVFSHVASNYQPWLVIVKGISSYLKRGGKGEGLKIKVSVTCHNL